MAKTNYDRTIAFAGLCQAAALVQKIARDGQCDSNAFEASLKSILVTDPATTLDVFGHDERNLETGLDCLVNGLNDTPAGSELTRYIISLMALEKKVAGKQDACVALDQRIDTLVRQSAHFEINEPQMISNCASVYLDVISPIGPRIQVTGTPAVLQQAANQHKVRALLLAGIRCAVLWRQVGGGRRHVIFGRKKMVEQARNILAKLS